MSPEVATSSWTPGAFESGVMSLQGRRSSLGKNRGRGKIIFLLLKLFHPQTPDKTLFLIPNVYFWLVQLVWVHSEDPFSPGPDGPVSVSL